MEKSLFDVGHPETCFGCGLHDPRVEAGGIWYCPNRFCLITGAWHQRLEAGYQDENGGQTDDQLARMIADCDSELSKLEAMAAAYRRAAEKLRARVASGGA